MYKRQTHYCFEGLCLCLLLIHNENVFFTGEAGTGKSHLLRVMVTALQQQLGANHVYVTASTGIAANHIDGTTIHSFAGMTSPDINPTYIYKQILNQSTKEVINHWKTCEVLIIDEISMIDGRFFDTLEYKARRCLLYTSFLPLLQSQHISERVS